MTVNTTKIALTGGIASGKSEASNYLIKFGFSVLDLDQVAREVVDPNTKALEQLVEYFGAHILDEKGQMRRNHMRALMISDPKSRKVVESILHPHIFAKMRQWLEACPAKIAIVVVPLLVETKAWRQFDRALVIDCTPEIQLTRLLTRPQMTVPVAKALINMQASRAKRLELCQHLPTDIINNQGLFEDFEQAICNWSVALASAKD